MQLTSSLAQRGRDGMGRDGMGWDDAEFFFMCSSPSHTLQKQRKSKGWVGERETERVIKVGRPPGCWDLVGFVADRSFCDGDGVGVVAGLRTRGQVFGCFW